ARSLFAAMAVSSWQEQSLEAIEGEVQRLLAQLGTCLLENFILPKRVAAIEQDVEAGQRGCAHCQARLRRHKQGQAIHPKTLFGTRLTLTRTQYYCRSCQRYATVADQELGLSSHQMTARLATVVALCGASWSYPVASAFLAFLLGVEVADKTVELVTKDQALLPAELPAAPLAQPPGVVTADGALIQGRKKDAWLEMKVASFFSQTVALSQGRRAVQDASFVASAVREWREFVEPVTAEAFRRGLSGWEAVDFVS